MVSGIPDDYEEQFGNSISAFYPHLNVLSPVQCFIPISASYSHFSILFPFQRFIPILAFYSHFSVLSPFQRFIPISVSVFSFRFSHSVSELYSDDNAQVDLSPLVLP